MMTIDKNIQNEITELTVSGRLDTTTAPEFEAALHEVLDNTKRLVLNFEKLEYLSSAGLRVILIAQKAMNKRGIMKFINVNDGIMEIFRITGFLDILTIE